MPPGSVRAISKNQVRSARHLLTRKGREAAGEFLVEGAQAVREALARPDLVRLVIVDDPAGHADLVARVPEGRVVQASPEQCAHLADTVTSQNIFAVCGQVAADWSAMPDSPRLVVVCAQVRDPGNAGTVIRCADAFGADAVVLTTGSVDLHNPKVVRASVGSMFHLPVITGVSVEDAVSRLQQSGVQVLAAAGGGESLDDLARAGDLARPTAWMMGNEAWGLPDHERSLADRVVGVPMWGRAESLNLSTAAAVCLYTTASAQR